MKAYPLEKLQRVAGMRLEAADARLRTARAAEARADSERQRCEQALAGLARQRKDRQRQQMERLGAGGCSAEFSRADQHIGLIEAQLIDAADALKTATAALDEAREATLAARAEYLRLKQRVDALQTRREMWSRDQRLVAERDEELASEELTSNRMHAADARPSH